MGVIFVIVFALVCMASSVPQSIVVLVVAEMVPVAVRFGGARQ